MDDDVQNAQSYYYAANFTYLQKRNGDGLVDPYAPLLNLNVTYANPSLSCGGLFVDENTVFSISPSQYDICWDYIGMYWLLYQYFGMRPKVTSTLCTS